MVAPTWCRDNKFDPLPVLVIMCHTDVTRLWNLIADSGMEVVVRTSIEEVMNSLKHGRFTAILTYRELLAEDPLELILNVRDRDSNIPIIVFGASNDENYERILAGRDGVYVLPDVRQSVRIDLPGLLSAQPNRSEFQTRETSSKSRKR